MPGNAEWFLTTQLKIQFEIRDEFLSEEDLELRNMIDEEPLAYWEFWLLQAQASNDQDEHTYSHGVFVDLYRIMDELNKETKTSS
jgi:hypothetical protein